MASPKIYRFSRRIEYDVIISTGAAVAISAVPTHLISRKKFYYFESLTRVVNPSMTGRILEFFPTVKKFSPSASNLSIKWKLGPNILDSFRVKTSNELPSKRRILVTVGTISNFRFDRLIDFVLQKIQPDDQVIWQIGCTGRSDLPGEFHTTIPKDHLLEIAKQSDVVFSHCGIGTMMDLLEIGVRPMVMTRLARYQEHIDDHQVEALKIFTKLDLALEITEGMSEEYIFNSARKRIHKLN
jgi:UDP-N-acetylglucosamine transferase subunit ALG13